jgi:hypothetical protein
VAHASVWGGEAGNFASSTFGYLVIFLTASLLLLALMQDVAIAGPTWGLKPKKIKPVGILDNPKSASAATRKLATTADELLARIAGRVPSEVYDKVKLICDLALSGLEAKSAKTTIGDRDAFDLTQIITSYLPEGVDAYLSVPKRFAVLGLRGHRPPYDILMEQLALIESDCRNLTETAVLNRTQRLETQERFLRDKTTSSSIRLE